MGPKKPKEGVVAARGIKPRPQTKTKPPPVSGAQPNTASAPAKPLDSATPAASSAPSSGVVTAPKPRNYGKKKAKPKAASKEESGAVESAVESAVNPAVGNDPMQPYKNVDYTSNLEFYDCAVPVRELYQRAEAIIRSTPDTRMQAEISDGTTNWVVTDVASDYRMNTREDGRPNDRRAWWIMAHILRNAVVG